MNLLFSLLKKQIGFIWVTISISILSILISLWWNKELSDMINMISQHNRIPVKLITVAIIIIFLSSGINFILRILSSQTTETITHALRMRYAKYFTSLSYQDIDTIGAGEYVSKLQNEVIEISNYMREHLFQMIDDIIRFLFTFTWMLFLDRKLTIFAHLPMFIIIGYIVFSSRILEGLAHQSQEANKQMCGYTDTLTTVFPILRIYDAAALVCKGYNKTLQVWEDCSRREEVTRAKLMSLSAILSCLPLLLLLYLGGRQVIHGVLPIGTLYIFINLSGNVSGIMMNMPGRISAFRRFIANMNRMETSICNYSEPRESRSEFE